MVCGTFNHFGLSACGNRLREHFAIVNNVFVQYANEFMSLSEKKPKKKNIRNFQCRIDKMRTQFCRVNAKKKSLKSFFVEIGAVVSLGRHDIS